MNLTLHLPITPMLLIPRNDATRAIRTPSIVRMTSVNHDGVTGSQTASHTEEGRKADMRTGTEGQDWSIYRQTNERESAESIRAEE